MTLIQENFIGSYVRNGLISKIQKILKDDSYGSKR